MMTLVVEAVFESDLCPPFWGKLLFSVDLLAFA